MLSKSKTVEIKAGMLILQSFCSPSLLEHLRADDGLRAFARLPEREYELLRDIARKPECVLTLAYTATGEIVGEVTLAPADSWWQGIANVYEIGLEVSYHWRRMGIAQQLLALALELDALEDVILLGIGLRWHWDTERAGVHAFRYRQLIAQTLLPYGFLEYHTLEPNIASEPANILLARIGSRVDQGRIMQFSRRLLEATD